MEHDHGVPGAGKDVVVVVRCSIGSAGRYAEDMTEADKLRERWKIAQPILDELDRRDAEAHLARPVGERLEEGVQHADALLGMFPPRASIDDDEAETWFRMRARLWRAG